MYFKFIQGELEVKLNLVLKKKVDKDPISMVKR